jgi:hypothetical protein
MLYNITNQGVPRGTPFFKKQKNQLKENKRTREGVREPVKYKTKRARQTLLLPPSTSKQTHSPSSSSSVFRPPSVTAAAVNLPWLCHRKVFFYFIFFFKMVEMFIEMRLTHNQNQNLYENR